jgi:hypothetical protein
MKKATFTVESNEIKTILLNLGFRQTLLLMKIGEKAIAATSIRKNRSSIGETLAAYALATITSIEKKTTVPKRASNALNLVLINFLSAFAENPDLIKNECDIVADLPAVQDFGRRGAP